MQKKVSIRELIIYFSLLLISINAGGCAQAILTAGATTGVAIAQERTLGDVIDDTAIIVSIKDKLFSLSDDVFLRVSIKSSEGRVLLTGNVAKTEHRIEASKIAWNTKGVKEVYNEINVRDRSNIKNYFKDILISNELRLRILKEKNISALNYNIETVNQVVYIMGIADSNNELSLVMDQARNIRGVEKVLSFVILKNDERRK
ncbi:MAG: Osmotically-inducible protein Y [Alphaproteobacteria bacterium MarineAlpha2_Bin1]|nr:MAG: Osmotically-inducible protein Y [Alphaproteobacteria bacterium MarineAlpha2_Bin1]